MQECAQQIQRAVEHRDTITARCRALLLQKIRIRTPRVLFKLYNTLPKSADESSFNVAIDEWTEVFNLTSQKCGPELAAWIRRQALATVAHWNSTRYRLPGLPSRKPKLEETPDWTPEISASDGPQPEGGELLSIVEASFKITWRTGESESAAEKRIRGEFNNMLKSEFQQSKGKLSSQHAPAPIEFTDWYFDCLADLPRLIQPVITEDFRTAANSFGVR